MHPGCLTTIIVYCQRTTTFIGEGSARFIRGWCRSARLRCPSIYYFCKFIYLYWLFERYPHTIYALLSELGIYNKLLSLKSSDQNDHSSSSISFVILALLVLNQLQPRRQQESQSHGGQRWSSLRQTKPGLVLVESGLFLVHLPLNVLNYLFSNCLL